MVDALASGASVRKDVEVRVLSWAPNPPKSWFISMFCWRGALPRRPRPPACQAFPFFGIAKGFLSEDLP